MYLFRNDNYIALNEPSQPSTTISIDQLDSYLDQLIGTSTPLHLAGISDQQFLDHCRQRFHCVHAAGGVVRSTQGNYLLINRNNRWDLPKGKIEVGEQTEQAALREVMEETGVTHLSIVRPLAVTHHIYNIYGPWSIKDTSWFLMSTTDEQPPIPQTDEGIAIAQWVSRQQRDTLLNSSFPLLAHLNKLID